MVRYDMKKIPKSVTVTVRNGDYFRATKRGKIYAGEGVEYDGVLYVFPDTPPPPYRLTYRLDKKGPLQIEVDDPYVNVLSVEGWFLITTCFLPLSWHSLWVSRKVTKL